MRDPNCIVCMPENCEHGEQSPTREETELWELREENRVLKMKIADLRTTQLLLFGLKEKYRKRVAELTSSSSIDLARLE